jgi:hypothetical protein
MARPLAGFMKPIAQVALTVKLVLSRVMLKPYWAKAV